MTDRKLDGNMDLEPVALTELGLFLNGSTAVVAVIALAVAVMFTTGWLVALSGRGRGLTKGESVVANFLLAGAFWFLSFAWGIDAFTQGLIRFSLANPQEAELLVIWAAILSRGIFCLSSVAFVVFAIRLTLKRKS